MFDNSVEHRQQLAHAGDQGKLETSIPIKTESDTPSHSHPCLCELQVPATVRVAEKDGPAQMPNAQKRASNILFPSDSFLSDPVNLQTVFPLDSLIPESVITPPFSVDKPPGFIALDSKLH